MASFPFETTVDDVVKAFSSEIKDKNVIITGASPKSVAFEAAYAIATQKPGLLVLATRKMSLLEKTKAEILQVAPGANLRLISFDLASQESIREAATEIGGFEESFDVLLNVAGIMATPYSQTVDAIESQFAVNHIGPFLLTNLVIQKLRRNARIINVSSRGYQLAPILWEDVNFEENPYNKWQAYAQSKAANILFSSALAKKLESKQIRSFSVHPGSIPTNLGRFLTQEDLDMLQNMPMKLKSPQQGAANMVIAAFDPSNNDENGGHYDDDNMIKPIPQEFAYATGADNENRMWTLSEDLVKQKFEY